MMKKWLLTLACCSALQAKPLEIPVDDHFCLPAQIDVPAQARGVVVLIHGSGAHGMDEDLSPVSKDKPNLFFADLSAALQKQGLAVLRFDKRNYVLQKRPDEAAKRPLLEHPGLTLIQDAASAVAIARQQCPGLPVFLIGHSEGTWVGLQLCRQDPSLAGLGLIGTMGNSLDSLILEQVAYRPLDYFQGLDKNHNGLLEAEELDATLRPQMAVIDQNRDGQLSRSEFQGGNWSNLLLRPIINSAWRKDEASLPTTSEIIEETELPLVFLQGDWDNQTPAYFVKALEICETSTWKKGNKHFVYFPRCGHALDPRERYDDVVFRRPDQATLERAARELAQFWFRRR